VNRINWAEIGLVWRKEMLDTLRDRRTILAMIVLPLLVYPLLIMGISQLGIRQVQKIRESLAVVAVVPEGAAPGLVGALAADSTISLVAPLDPEAALEARDIDAIVRMPADFETLVAEGRDADVVIRVDLSRDRGREVRDRVEGFLAEWRSDLVSLRLADRGLADTFVRPFRVQTENAAGARKMGGSIIGQILPMLLVIMMMTGALYPAIDVTAGERERGTLETLLVSPGSRFSIVIGKYLTVFVASMVTALANLVSMAFTVFYLVGSANLGGGMGENLPSLIDWRAFFAVLLVMVPMALFFCGLAMLVASFARSYKEAQNYLSPLLIACMAPTYLALLPGFELSYEIALIPIANVVLLSRELFLGNYPWNYFAITLATLSGLALLMLSRTVSLFSREAVLGGSDSGQRISWRALFADEKRGRAETLSPGMVAPVFALVLLGFFYIGGPLQLADLRWGLVVTQILVIAGFPVIALRVYRIPVADTLRAGPSRPSALALAALLMPAATMSAALAASLQSRVISVPESYRELMERLVTVEGGGGLVAGIVVFAVIPGICEEILFRGFVLRGLAVRMKGSTAVIATAVLFGAFHFDLYRLIPTTILGLFLGYVALATGRLWPAMVIHVLNNAFAVLATNLGAFENVAWLKEDGAVPLPIILGAFLLGGAAVWGLRRLRSRPPDAASGLGKAPSESWTVSE
jgi:sodium transport system permease protein